MTELEKIKSKSPDVNGNDNALPVICMKPGVGVRVGTESKFNK